MCPGGGGHTGDTGAQLGSLCQARARRTRLHQAAPRLDLARDGLYFASRFAGGRGAGTPVFVFWV
jgi:hypothetical protein